MLDDILHVRLQTLGVTEHSFDINVAGTHYTWLLYDVGGAVSFFYVLVSTRCSLLIAPGDREAR